MSHARQNKVGAHAWDNPPPPAAASKLGNWYHRYWTRLGVGYGVRFVMYLAWPIEVVHLGFEHIIHHRTHTYFRAACSVYGVFWSTTSPLCGFCDDTDICGLPECIYIIPLTDNEWYVLAMNGFLLVRVRAGHHQMSVNQSSSSCIVRIPSQMLGLLGSTYIKPCIRISSLTTLPSWLLSVLRGRHHI